MDNFHENFFEKIMIVFYLPNDFTGLLAFKSTLSQSKAWIKGFKGTVINLSENTGSSTESL